MFVYEPDQLAIPYPYFPKGADWFLLGGPADANEAFVMKALRPDINIIGFEPNPVFFAAQEKRLFPGLLLPVALWEDKRQLDLVVPDVSGSCPEENRERSASLTKYASSSTVRPVCADTLDNLSVAHGPFTKAILWIDIEESEVECLRGACKLLEAGEILAINAEVFRHDEKTIASYLKPFGLAEVFRWNVNNVNGREWCNIVYGRK